MLLSQKKKKEIFGAFHYRFKGELNYVQEEHIWT